MWNLKDELLKLDMLVDQLTRTISRGPDNVTDEELEQLIRNILVFVGRTMLNLTDAAVTIAKAYRK